jgi:hypothetical protein
VKAKTVGGCEEIDCLEEVEAYPVSKQPTSVETESVVVNEEVSQEGAAVKTRITEGMVWRPASSRSAPPTTEEMEPGQWWVPEVGRRPQTNDPPCRNGTA